MKSILFALQKPENLAETESWRWNGVANNIADLKSSNGVEHFGAGCVLISQSEGLKTLADAINLAERAKFPYRTLFIDSMTEWVRVQPSTTTP